MTAPVDVREESPRWQRACASALWALMAFAGLHRLQVLSPVDKAPDLALLAIVGLSRLGTEIAGVRLDGLQRLAIFGLAWATLPGMLDRSMYPHFNFTPFWLIGWTAALLSWGAALGPAQREGFSSLGVFAALLALFLMPELATDPRLVALGLASLAVVAILPVRAAARDRELGFRSAFAACAIVAIALTQPAQLGSGPEERLLEAKERVGRTLSVVQSPDGKEVTLRDKFHQRVFSSKATDELRRHGLLPFRVHAASPLTRMLFLGASDPYAVSAALEAGGVQRIDWVDPDRTLFELSRWWISPEAARNTSTLANRVIDAPGAYLEAFVDQSWDAAVLSPTTPWTGAGASLLEPRIPRLVRERLYADGVAIQWIQIQQWTEASLVELIRRWMTAFEGRVELWRSDLAPSSPYVAIVARSSASEDASAATAARPIRVSDRFLGASASSLSLQLADARGLREWLDLTAPSSPRMAIQNPWKMASYRSPGSELLSTTWLIQRMLPAATRMGGPVEGGLRYTYSALLYRRGDSTWRAERSKATSLLGFDPTEDLYREWFPGEKSALPFKNRR